MQDLEANGIAKKNKRVTYRDKSETQNGLFEIWRVLNQNF